MIHIGDQHQYYRLPEPKARNTGTLLKLALAGGLLATGAGSGIGAALLVDALRPKAGAAMPAERTDRDTQYELRLGRVE